MITERWLVAVGWRGMYEVSDLGNVRALAHPVRTKGGVYRLSPARILKQGGTKYKHVVLSRDGRRQTVTVHRLVLEAFVGPRPPGMECLHGPGGQHDNRLTNIRWGTREENNADKVKSGSLKGERNPNSWLSDDDVANIRRMFSEGQRGAVIARLYGISRTHAYHIRDRKKRC